MTFVSIVIAMETAPPPVRNPNPLKTGLQCISVILAIPETGFKQGEGGGKKHKICAVWGGLRGRLMISQAAHRRESTEEMILCLLILFKKPLLASVVI